MVTLTTTVARAGAGASFASGLSDKEGGAKVAALFRRSTEAAEKASAYPTEKGSKVVTFQDLTKEAPARLHLTLKVEEEKQIEGELIFNQLMLHFHNLLSFKGFSEEDKEKVRDICNHFMDVLLFSEEADAVLDAFCDVYDEILVPALVAEEETPGVGELEEEFKTTLSQLLPGVDIEFYLTQRSQLVNDFLDDEAASAARMEEVALIAEAATEGFSEHAEEKRAAFTSEIERYVEGAERVASSVRERQERATATAAAVDRDLKEVGAQDAAIDARLEANKIKTAAQEARAKELIEGIGKR